MRLRLFYAACLLLGATLCGAAPANPVRLQEDSTQAAEAFVDVRTDIEAKIAEYDSLKGSSSRKALKAIKEAVRLADLAYTGRLELLPEDIRLWQGCRILLAQAHFDKGRYLNADTYLDEAAGIAYPIPDSGNAQVYAQLNAQLDSILADMAFPKTKEWIHNANPAREARQKLDDANASVKAGMEARLFRTYAANGKVQSAETHAQQAIQLYRSIGKTEQLEALETEYTNWKAGLPPQQDGASTLDAGDSILLQSAERLENLRQEADAIERAVESAGSKALMERYKALQMAIAEEEQKSALALLEKQNQLEDQEREILLLEQDNALNALILEQERSRSEARRKTQQNLSMLAGLLAALFLSLIVLYRNKIQNNKQLKAAGEKLEEARLRIASLLNQQVSGDIADALIEGEVQAVQERFVAVLFLDIRGFTPKVAPWKPEEINAYQNDVFGFMIDIVEAHHGNINQLLGDGFMATFGAPKSAGNDVQHAVDASLAILDKLEEKNKTKSIPTTEIGIGIDCGTAVMGNVGNATRKQFSITGHVVISAARIEQCNKRFGSRMLISQAVQSRTRIAEPIVQHTTTLKGQQEERTLFQVR